MNYTSIEITMTTIKSYTNIEQSNKLAEILPLESADYCWGLDNKTFRYNSSPYPCAWKDYTCKEYYIPCWSLAALLEQLPYELCDDDGNSYYLSMNKDDDMYQLSYSDRYGEFDDIETDIYEYFVDACYEMILKLRELKIL